MKRTTRLIALALCLLLAALSLTGCAPAGPAKYVILADALDAEQFGIGFRIDDIALGLEVQHILDEMAADGAAAEISKKWFGEDILMKDAAYIKESVAPEGDNSLELVKQKGVFVLGLDDSFPPMGFRDENNNIVGFDIDLAKEVCKRMGVELQLQPINWDAKELELNTNKIDCIWNGMTINDDRVAAMFFTKPYLANKQVIVVADSSSIKSKDDLAGKIVGLQKGSSALDALEKNAAVYESVKEVVELDENVTVFMDLKTSRIDAAVMDIIAASYIIANDKGNP